MRNFLKKASAFLLVFSLCFCSVVQAAPETGIPKQPETALENMAETETEPMTEEKNVGKKDASKTDETTDSKETAETTDEKKDAGKEEMTEKSTENTETGMYTLSLPAEDGVAYDVDQSRVSGLSTEKSMVLLYKEGEMVSFTVSGEKEFSVVMVEGNSVFLKAEDIHDGKVGFAMPAAPLSVSFKAGELEKDPAKENTTEAETAEKDPGDKETKETETSAKPEQETAEETEEQTEKQTEKKAGQSLEIKVNGEAYANAYYGISDFDEAVDHAGTRKTITDSFTVDLKDVKKNKIWVYAQSTGDLGFSGISLPDGVSKEILKSMPGMGGHVFFVLDTSEFEDESGTVTINFGRSEITRVSRAGGVFNTSTKKKLTGLTYTWRGGFPSMYASKPATGEISIWGNGTWTIPRPSVDTICSLFGVTKPDGARFNNVGTDGSGNVYMRCTGVSDTGNHSGLSSTDAYIQCIEIDEDDGSATYTFRLWGANGGRGQTTEGYIQMTCRQPKDTDIRLEKTIRAGSRTDLLGQTTIGSKAGARFRLFKLNNAGAKKIADDHNKNYDTNSEWWAAHATKAGKKTVMGYVENLMISGNASPGDTDKNPNSAYFSYVGTYTTDDSGLTDWLSIAAGASDYYVVFERKSPDGMNMGYHNQADVPAGKHYFYKIFSAYGDGNIIMRDAEGNETKDEDSNLTVSIADEPVLVDIALQKTFDPNETPEMKGLAWKDFEFLISDNSSFTGNVTTVALTEPTTTIKGLFAKKKYYLKENPSSPACLSDIGYAASPNVFSFYPEDDGGVTYSDTHPIEVGAIEAVDAYKHAFFSIKNDSSEGDVRLIKTSAVPDITLNNKCYSLAGATYQIYQKASQAAANTGGIFRGTLVTDEAGISNTIKGVPTGYYYAVETVAPKGFLKNEDPIPFTVRKGRLNDIGAKDIPLDDPIGILLKKVDSESDDGTPQGKTALEGAEYTVRYYDGYYSTSEELKDIEPIRSWVFRTDLDGAIELDVDSPISGDKLYVNDMGRVTFPLGTVSIQETKAPDGYNIDNTVYVYTLRAGGVDGATLEAWNTATMSEEPIRGDFRMPKISDDGTPLANVPFRLTSMTTGESHVIVTDENGILDTSKKHSVNTNRGETSEDGIWFGEIDALDDEKGALLYDTYRVEEILCESNKDKFMIEPFTVEINEDSVTKELEPVEDETKDMPKLKTTATDSESQGHDAYVSETTTIIDVVEYANLEVGKKYIFSGYLVLKETGEPLLNADGNRITDSVTVTIPETAEDFEPTIEGSDDARYGRGTVELTFTFDSSLLKGKSVVVFEDLYLEEFHVGVHADINDEGQTVNFRDPAVSTTATNKNTGKHYAPLEKEVTIIDEVAYESLIPGNTYVMKGILMDKATGEPLLVNEEHVVSEKEFIPENADGTVTLEYVLDSTELEDVTTVVFETLYYQDREIASHADINDENQEVYFTDVKFGTTAKDQETGLNDGIVSGNTTIIDTVQYTGLIPGREYTVKGILMDKATGEPFLADGKKVESSTTFTPESKEGSVDVVFVIDSSLLKGKPVVAFETMYQNEKEVGIHADINDGDQTVDFHDPEIGTTAAEKELGEHQAFVNTETTITDVVHYKDLVPGVEYRISGVLMDIESGKPIQVDGVQVVSEAVFTPDTAEGDAEVTFSLDSTALAGKTTVVFETLYIGERKIASHEELDDKQQSVSFMDVELRTSASDQKSGTKEADPEQKVTIVDKVSYTGLIAGEKYTVSGVLMDKETGKPLKVNGKKVTAVRTFKAEKAKGSIEMKFTFDASKLEGRTLVVFENLSYNEREIAVHADLKDKDQTVRIKKVTVPVGVASPRTGDSTNTLPFIILGAAAGLIMICTYRKKKKIN